MKRNGTIDRSLFQRFFDDSTDYIAFVELDKKGNTKRIHLNRSARKVLCIASSKNLTKLKLADIFPDWSLDIIQHKAIPSLLKKHVWRGKIALKNKKGEEIPISQKMTAHTNQRTRHLSRVGPRIVYIRTDCQTT